MDLMPALSPGRQKCPAILLPFEVVRGNAFDFMALAADHNIV